MEPSAVTKALLATRLMEYGVSPDEAVLVACECSGSIRDALLSLGIPAMSCDIKPTEAEGPHYEGPAQDILQGDWRGLIAHPVCTYLTNAGAKHLYIDGKKENGINVERWRGVKEGARFFRLFKDAKHIKRRAVENPIPHKLARALMGGRATQYVQPWWFGDEAFKATGWWLEDLPPLVPTNKLTPPKPGTKEHKEWSAVWLCPPGPERQTIRSRFHPGHAAAVASQWGPLFMEDRE